MPQLGSNLILFFMKGNEVIIFIVCQRLLNCLYLIRKFLLSNKLQFQQSNNLETGVSNFVSWGKILSVEILLFLSVENREKRKIH